MNRWPLDPHAPNWHPLPPDWLDRLPFIGQWPKDPHAPKLTVITHKAGPPAPPGGWPPLDAETMEGVLLVPKGFINQ